jgi:transcriptional regulator with XRE-family HTH domain
MRSNLLRPLGEVLRRTRRERGLTQLMLAARLGRSASRISELEKDLLTGRQGKDRLTLLVEICDALDLVPVLVSRERAHDLTSSGRLESKSPGTPPTIFDEIFTDLSDEDEDSSDG